MALPAWLAGITKSGLFKAGLAGVKQGVTTSFANKTAKFFDKNRHDPYYNHVGNIAGQAYQHSMAPPTPAAQDSSIKIAELNASKDMKIAEMQDRTKIKLQQDYIKFQMEMESHRGSSKGLYQATKDVLTGKDAQEVLDDYNRLEHRDPPPLDEIYPHWSFRYRRNRDPGAWMPFPPDKQW